MISPVGRINVGMGISPNHTSPYVKTLYFFRFSSVLSCDVTVLMINLGLDTEKHLVRGLESVMFWVTMLVLVVTEALFKKKKKMSFVETYVATKSFA